MKQIQAKVLLLTKEDLRGGVNFYNINSIVTDFKCEVFDMITRSDIVYYKQKVLSKDPNGNFNCISHCIKNKYDYDEQGHAKGNIIG